MFRFIILLLTLFLCGCPSLREYDNLDFINSGHELAKFHTITQGNYSVLSHYLSEEACEAVSNIPVIDGIMIDPFVVGVNFWSVFAGVISLNGYSKRVVLAKGCEHVGVRIILHEYIHHLDAMDRQGEGEWISHREFAIAFHRLLQDPFYEDKIEKKYQLSDRAITNIFGVGPMSELIAYIGSWVAEGNGPPYMRYVFRRILKNKKKPPKKAAS